MSHGVQDFLKRVCLKNLSVVSGCAKMCDLQDFHIEWRVEFSYMKIFCWSKGSPAKRMNVESLPEYKTIINFLFFYMSYTERQN